MSETTAIEWCDSTWNPWIGCTKVSPACDHCYAERSGPARTRHIGWGPGQPRVRTGPDNWALPRRWNDQSEKFRALHGRRRRVFCASLADWLDNEVPAEWLCDLLQEVRYTPCLDWLLLTKRVGNWRKRLQGARAVALLRGADDQWRDLAEWIGAWLDGKPPHNVWVGATVVDQAEANRDLPKLISVPAVVRFLSVEPMLGPIDLSRACAGYMQDFAVMGSAYVQWVICGGESGPHARPMHPDWVTSLREQCADAGVPLMFKQWGEWMPEQAMTWSQRVYESGTPEQVWVKLDGRTHWIDPQDHTPYDASDVRMVKVGKKAAGRVLDGKEHDGFPESVS